MGSSKRAARRRRAAAYRAGDRFWRRLFRQPGADQLGPALERLARALERTAAAMVGQAGELARSIMDRRAESQETLST